MAARAGGGARTTLHDPDTGEKPGQGGARERENRPCGVAVHPTGLVAEARHLPGVLAPGRGP